MSLSSEEDLYATLGYGGITLAQILPKIREYIKKEVPAEELEKWMPSTPKKESDKKNPVKKARASALKALITSWCAFQNAATRCPATRLSVTSPVAEEFPFTGKTAPAWLKVRKKMSA
jgi:GTP diphosphokinase / guanosine-3',5'-bis(diphosphate) 3'-diphosphatase